MLIFPPQNSYRGVLSSSVEVTLASSLDVIFFRSASCRKLEYWLLFCLPPHNCKINKTILNVFLIENLSVFSQIKQKTEEKMRKISLSIFQFSSAFGRVRRGNFFLFSMLEHEVEKGKKKGKKKSLI